MSDVLHLDPVPAEAFAGRDVTLRRAPDMTRYSIRARAAADVERLLGVSVPAKIGATAHGLACLGPDEWMLRQPENSTAPAMDDPKVAVTEISHRNISITVEGPRAIEVLSAGCPLDLSKFEIGRATRTIFETVEVLIERTSEESFHVEVWRSFAPWLWTALTSVAGE